MALTASLGVLMMFLGCAIHFPGQRYSKLSGSSDYKGSVSVHLAQLKMLTGGEYLLVSHDLKAWLRSYLLPPIYSAILSAVPHTYGLIKEVCQ